MKQIIGLFLILFCACSKAPNEQASKESKPALNSSEKIIRLSTIANVKGLDQLISTIQKAYTKIGYKVEIVQMPAVRAIKESNSGELVDGEVARTMFAQKFMTKQIRIPVSLGKIDISAFVKNKDLKIDGWKSLKGHNITSVRGYWIIQNNLQHISHLSEVVDATKALTFLKHDRTDVVVLLKKVGIQTINSLNYTDIKVLEPPIESMHIYHFINEKHKDLVPALTQAFSEVTGNKVEQ